MSKERYTKQFNPYLRLFFVNLVNINVALCVILLFILLIICSSRMKFSRLLLVLYILKLKAIIVNKNCVVNCI